jgi:hypothetical protein
MSTRENDVIQDILSSNLLTYYIENGLSKLDTTPLSAARIKEWCDTEGRDAINAASIANIGLIAAGEILNGIGLTNNLENFDPVSLVKNIVSCIYSLSNYPELWIRSFEETLNEKLNSNRPSGCATTLGVEKVEEV